MEIVEIRNNDFKLLKKRGFLIIHDKNQNKEIGNVPLDSVSALILTADNATLTKQIMVSLAKQGAPIVVCDETYTPSSIMLPYGSHYKHTERVKKQINATPELLGKLWKKIITYKIYNQAQTLEYFYPNHPTVKTLKYYSQRVRWNDGYRYEAYTAREYFKALFPRKFKRDRDASDINIFLNYGYTILRSTIARYLVASGLNPALGIHHSNTLNPYVLVDDMIEPYRPLVDFYALNLWKTKEHTLTPTTKRKLISILSHKIRYNKKETSIEQEISAYINSLAQSYLKGKVVLKHGEFIW